MELLPDIVLTAVVLMSLPACLRFPWIGALIWCWLGFMNPHRWMNGFAADLHFSKLVAIATIVGIPFTTARARLPMTREVALFFAFWAITALSTLCAAIHPQLARAYFADVSKIWLMNVVVVLLLFQERRKLEILMWVVTMSLGVYATAGAAWAFNRNAGQPFYGPPNSQLYDNNDLAAALVLLLPLLAVLVRQAANRWTRLALTGVFAANVAALVATYSRAGFLGGIVVAAGLAWSRQFRLLAVAAATLVILSAVHAIPVEWTTRMASIAAPATTTHTDASMVTRLNAWFVAWKLGTDHPLLGAGFAPFAPAVYAHYLPGSSDYHNAHNLFLQVFAEHGVPGLLVYSALLLCTLQRLWQIARRSAANGEQRWLVDMAQALTVAMAGFLTCAMFHCLSYKDLLFQCVAVAILLDVLAQRSWDTGLAADHRVGST